MDYETIWSAVDNLAASLGLTPSGLAKKAGLDSTTFNKSKRKRRDGKNRWPSLESLNKIFDVCHISFEEFYELGRENNIVENLKAIPYSKISKLSGGISASAYGIETKAWKMVSFPDSYNNIYALEIDTMKYSPDYRAGTVLILSKNSDIRKNDLVAVYKKDNTIVIGEFYCRTPNQIELHGTGGNEKEMLIDIKDIIMLNRIMWISA